ncbi:hypothetical protein NXA99_07245 [Citrobacter amalonaticus]|jgi:hypothetical protein|uniref:hypothetical protein n=1 Tax=Citrobacter amalonaticus TaxID=35703 RepID=UPI00215C2DA1|nr:hypothetical protein [Citrobacter amalonaticus]MCR9028328.1 hypothetical protein [Citrobacter amalonaticus]
MARNIEVEINEVTYTGQTSSAKDQIEMLQIATANGVLPVLKANVSDMALAASIASLDAHSLKRVKELALNGGKIIRLPDNAPVAENLFQDQIHFYMLLLGRVMQENIGPFWSLSLGTEGGKNNNEE